MESFDLLSYLDDRDIPYSTSGKNIGRGWIGIRCVACEDHSTHLGINLYSNAFSCFRCGEKGGTIKLLMLLEGCGKDEALKVSRKFSKSEIFYKPEKESAVTIQQPKGLIKKFDPIFKNYLVNRNFDPDYLIKKYDLYSGGYFGDFPLSIVAPIYLEGEIVSYVGRDVSGKANLRYKNYPIEKSIIPATNTLYNIDSVKDRAIIVEGIFDVFRLGEGSIAIFGIQYSHSQIEMILRKVKGKIFIMFDANAQKEAYKLGRILQSLGKETENCFCAAEDPADLNEFEVRKLKKELRLF
jgi:DNA primase